MEKELEHTAGTVLVVGDSAINRAVLEHIFAQHYKVIEAENGREALDMLMEYQKDLCAVILDVVMPEMDGIEVLEKMNLLGVTEHIPVFLITAETAGDMLKKAYELGVMDVVEKPVVPYVVERRIGSVIELFRARRQLSVKVEEQQNEIVAQQEHIIRLNIGMIEALSTAIEFRSGESGGHVRRIRNITEYLLKNTELGEGLSDQEIMDIALASIMHDVGKIAIPDAILNKPGRLTPEEFEIMKTHTTQGGELLKKISLMREHEAFRYAYDIAVHHHERYDGKGYPEGLKGDEISLWAQIVSLADVYDALISKRIYKDAFGADEAVQMMKDGKCGVFNPRYLEVFLREEPGLRKFYTKDSS